MFTHERVKRGSNWNKLIDTDETYKHSLSRFAQAAITTQPIN